MSAVLILIVGLLTQIVDLIRKNSLNNAFVCSPTTSIVFEVSKLSVNNSPNKRKKSGPTNKAHKKLFLSELPVRLDLKHFLLILFYTADSCKNLCSRTVLYCNKAYQSKLKQT